MTVKMTVSDDCQDIFLFNWQVVIQVVPRALTSNSHYIRRAYKSQNRMLKERTNLQKKCRSAQTTGNDFINVMRNIVFKLFMSISCAYTVWVGVKIRVV